MSDSSLYKVLNAFIDNFGALKQEDLKISKNNGDSFFVFMRNYQFLITLIISVPLLLCCFFIFRESPFLLGDFDKSISLLLLFVFLWMMAFVFSAFICLMLFEAMFSLFKETDSSMEGFYRGFMSDLILNKRKDSFMKDLGVDLKNMGSSIGERSDLAFLELIKDFEISVSGDYSGRYEKKIANDLLLSYQMALISNKKRLAKRYLNDGAFYLMDKMRRHFSALDLEKTGQKSCFGKLNTEQIKIEILD